MPEEKLQTLSLQVINGSELESGRAARCLFTQQGNVGHGPECHWSVQDRQQSIPAQAFTVILHDGTFCLRPQTAQLWLNQAKVTATSDLIQLRQGDEIQIGRLMVRVHLNRGDIPHYDEEMATPETIVTNRDMLTDTLLSTEGTPHYPGMTHRHQLADTVVNGFSADPLQALQSESLITTGDPLSGIAAVRPSAPLSDPASNGGINTPFMDLPPIYASPGDRNDDVSAAEMAQLENYERRLQQLLDTSPVQPLETGMQMMRVADSRWPESLQQQQASTQWNEALKTRAQSSPQLRGWLQTRQDLHAFADLVMQREKEGLTLSYIKNVIWQAERGLGQETPVESLLTQYHDARAQKQNTDALEKQINERLEGVLSRWLLLKNNVMPEAATGTTAEK